MGLCLAIRPWKWWVKATLNLGHTEPIAPAKTTGLLSKYYRSTRLGQCMENRPQQQQIIERLRTMVNLANY